ncbi:MAG TPA: M50 family metallopeptidase [Anaerolineales bacterium]|jgi:regulator of sigma E protease|nr:M50 family metallopeptidase [Anaerolineales bacterium]
MLTTLYFIFALAFLILIHELGHFIAAKIVGIPIQEFGIGFPPRIITLFRSGETEFTLNWLPFGGFVRPREREGDEQIPDELMAAAPWKRIFMLLAGSITNLVAAVLLLSFAYYQIGNKLDHVLITRVDPDSPAEAAGLLSEDLITAIDGIEIESIDELQLAISEKNGGPIELTYLRGEQTNTVTITPRTEYNALNEGPIGVGLFTPLNFPGAVAESVNFLVFQVQQITSIPFRLVGLKGMFDGFQLAQDMDASETSIAAGTNTIWFIASISFSLGLINLLPIPLFDGGKILLALPELLFKKRVPLNLYYMLNLVSLGLVLLLMVYVNVQDFVNPSIDFTDLTPTP